MDFQERHFITYKLIKICRYLNLYVYIYNRIIIGGAAYRKLISILDLEGLGFLWHNIINRGRVCEKVFFRYLRQNNGVFYGSTRYLFKYYKYIFEYIHLGP